MVTSFFNANSDGLFRTRRRRTSCRGNATASRVLLRIYQGRLEDFK